MTRREISVDIIDRFQRSYPVDIYRMADALGIEVQERELPQSISGKIEDDYFDGYVITVNSKHGGTRKRFTVAHEIAHYVLHRDLIGDGIVDDAQKHLVAIEAKMREIAKRDEPVVREVWKRDDAVRFFESIGEHYKSQIIASIPADEPIGLYREGAFIDLCRGPHVPSTGKLKVFKLMKLAGAYWRGDSKNEMLQRIYGTAWARKEDQDAYLHMLEEAEKRDRLSPRSEEPEPGTVQILTIHGSKGLEWAVVAVPRMVEDELPGKPQSKQGWLSFGELPYEFRGDAGQLPLLPWRAATTQAEFQASKETFTGATPPRGLADI